MMCFPGEKIEVGPFDTVILRRHMRCVGNNVMAGGWCEEQVICLTAKEWQLPELQRSTLINILLVKSIIIAVKRGENGPSK